MKILPYRKSKVKTTLTKQEIFSILQNNNFFYNESFYLSKNNIQDIDKKEKFVLSVKDYSYLINRFKNDIVVVGKFVDKVYNYNILDLIIRLNWISYIALSILVCFLTVFGITWIVTGINKDESNVYGIVFLMIMGMFVFSILYMAIVGEINYRKNKIIELLKAEEIEI